MKKLGRLVIHIFVGLLPWSVLIAVFSTEVLGLNFVRYWKEGMLMLVILLFGWDFFLQQKKKLRGDLLDLIILLYIAWLIGVSVFQGTSLEGYIYGLRYDTEFLIAFLIFRRALPSWNIHFTALLKTFVISGGCMLIVSLLIRYIFGEMILTFFGFSPLIGSGETGSAPPIYHDIRDATVIRFQGVLEGPNQMAFFLFTYIAAYATLFFHYHRYRFINSVLAIGIAYLFFETYSRSGYIGAFIGTLCTLFMGVYSSFSSQKLLPLFRRFLKTWFVVGIAIALLFSAILFQFRDQFYDIFHRDGSTSGHFERMMIGWHRFQAEPMGSGLAQAGPASRGIALVSDRPIVSEIDDPVMKGITKKLKENNPDFYFSTSNYYIPESWYIQQLVEGGVIGFALFVSILFLILMRLVRYKYFFGAFVGVITINIFLHSFESAHTSLALFVFLASLIPIEKFTFSSKLFALPVVLFIFLLPWHALLVTFFQCKMHVDPTFFRFWKELAVIVFTLFTAFLLFRRPRSLCVLLEWEKPFLWIMLSIALAIVYTYFPAGISSQSLLGLRYDIFFLLVFLVGYFFTPLAKYRDTFLMTLFVSSFIMLVIFIIWYLFFDIRMMTTILGYSGAVSTFDPASCLPFAQNVAGHHRLQASLGGPIRLSAFLVTVLLLFLGFLGPNTLRKWFLAFCVTFFVGIALYYSYSKTGYIGSIVGLSLFFLYFFKNITRKIRPYFTASVIILLLIGGTLLFVQRDLFIHKGATLERQKNLSEALYMIAERPLGYGLGKAGPASQIQGQGTQFQEAPQDFLPENWFLQIFIEQGIIGGVIFLVAMIFLLVTLIPKKYATPYDIGLFSAFCAVLVMALFTHVFEEAATSYILFLLLGIHLQKLGK